MQSKRETSAYKMTGARAVRRLLPLVIICLGMLTSMISCDRVEMPVYNVHEEFGSDGWDTFRALEFKPWPIDSVVDPRGYDMYICVRYTGKTRLRTLPVTMEENALEGELFDNPRESELRIPLYDDHNNPLGIHHYGIYEHILPLRRGITLPPGYTLSFTHTLPEADTRGLLTFGVILRHHDTSGK